MVPSWKNLIYQNPQNGYLSDSPRLNKSMETKKHENLGDTVEGRGFDS